MKYKKDKFTTILRQAGAAELSYGRYVAQELTKRTKRKPIPKDCISINDRKRLKIGMPIYCGTSTIAAAIWQDCPRTAGAMAGRAADPPPKAPPKQEDERRSFNDQVIFMYESGCKLSEIQSELCCPRSVIIGILRGADIDFRGKPPLPQNTISKMEAVRAEGFSYAEIAKECGVSEKTVQNYLGCS